MATNTIGECLCVVCSKVTALDLKIDHLTSIIEKLDVQSMENKLDIIFSTCTVTREQLNDVQSSLYKIQDDIKCVCEETPSPEVPTE